MFEGLYEPLPDVSAYLARIGIDRAEEPSLDFLDRIVLEHQCHVPFEDIDVLEHAAEPSLAIADLFDKVVTRRRGGYCFELNGLLASLLRALGFEVQAGLARVTMYPQPHPTITHRVSLVRLDGALYLADVGFGGPSPSFALKVEDGFSREELGQRFTIRAVSEHWWDVCYRNSAGEQQAVLRFCTLPADEVDFIPLSFYQSQNPDSVFRQVRLVNLRTPVGSRSLTAMSYTEREEGVETTRELTDDAELDAVLEEKFGISSWR